jgi:hypothetical protein
MPSGPSAGPIAPSRGLPARILATVLLLALAVACDEGSCLYTKPGRSAEWTRVKGEDGSELRLVERGPYRAYYDAAGRLQRIEFDSNGDGRPDNIAHHDGAERARLLEVDTNFDGTFDRWEHYDEEGRLVKVGVALGGTAPQRWSYLGPDGLPNRIEYDSDSDGRPERVEVFEAGRIVAVEVDSDRDGRIDRWQDWRTGILSFEDFDSDGDGRPDRRLHYDAGGKVRGIEKLKDAPSQPTR